jgi:hypothetical protein
VGDFDRSSKWLIQQHGDALLRLGGVRGIRAWKAVQSEVVQPAQLPDGLIEARLAGSSRLRRYVVEVATYPEKRAVEQLVRDALLVRLSYGRLPEVVALVLRPKGRFRIPELLREASDEGWTELNLRWRVVELWTLPAEELLAVGDPGLMPWVPLTQHREPPEVVIRRCRNVIETAPAEQERVNLLAVTQVLTRLRYNDPSLFALLGGRRIMIESPLIHEVFQEVYADELAEARAEASAAVQTKTVLRILERRIGSIPGDLRARVMTIQDESLLDRLIDAAVESQSIEEFERSLPA